MSQWRLICTVAVIAGLSPVITSQTSSGHATFQQALAKERVDGNLQEAIKLYERVVTEFASDRALAAKALVQVGLCYEKLGRDEAVKAYERLVRDFADQEGAVAHAREQEDGRLEPQTGTGRRAERPHELLEAVPQRPERAPAGRPLPSQHGDHEGAVLPLHLAHDGERRLEG